MVPSLGFSSLETCEAGNPDHGKWIPVNNIPPWEGCIIPGAPHPDSAFLTANFNAAFRIEGNLKISTVVYPAGQSLVGNQFQPRTGEWVRYTWYSDKYGKTVSAPAECPPECITGITDWYINRIISGYTNSEISSLSKEGQFKVHMYDNPVQMNNYVRRTCYTDKYVENIWEWVCNDQGVDITKNNGPLCPVGMSR